MGMPETGTIQLYEKDGHALIITIRPRPFVRAPHAYRPIDIAIVTFDPQLTNATPTSSKLTGCVLVVSQYSIHNAGVPVVSIEWISPNFANFLPALLENCLQHQGKACAGESKKS